MKGIYRPPRGCKPGFVTVSLDNWDHANSIVLMDHAQGPSFSGLISAIKANGGCGSEYRWTEIAETGQVVIVIQCPPGKDSILYINYPNANKHADVVWVNRQYAGIDKIMKTRKEMN